MTYPQYPPYQPASCSTYFPRMEQPPVYAQQAMQQQGGFLKGRPVTSEEEARGIPVDFDGSVMVFPDAAHGVIYTKQLNTLDGTAIFRRYALMDVPAQPAPPMPREYADKQEVLELRQLVAELQAAVDGLSRKPTRKRSVNNDESDDADSVDCQERR